MIRSRWLVAGPMLFPIIAHAQQAQPVPAATPTPAATPGALPIPAAPVGLPTPVATPTPTPTPAASPSPIATPGATSRNAAPRPSRSPAPAPSVSPIPAALPSPAAVVPPEAAPSAVPAAVPSPQPLPTASPAASAEDGQGGNATLWIVVLGLAVLAAVAGLFFGRRRARKATEAAAPAPDLAPRSPGAAPPVPAVDDAMAGPAPAATTEPTPALAPAQLAIDFRPVRAGVNLLSATVESEVVVTNSGTVPVADVRVEIRMIGAHSGQDADLAAIAAEAVARPAVAPFALPPGQFVQLSAVAALPRASIVPLDAGGRPIFVPIVTVKIEAMAGGAPLRHTAAFAIGVERVDSARLAPFRLDGPPRTFDTVAARPHPVG